MGAKPFPHQSYFYDVFGELDPDTLENCYDEAIFSGPRRMGKTFTVRPIVQVTCGGDSKRDIAITAQSGKQGYKRWIEVARALQRALPEGMVKMKVSQGYAELRWPKTDSTFFPFTPDADSLHGDELDKVIVDEYWVFSDEERREIEQAYNPIFSIKNGQVLKMSTAGTKDSEWFNMDRELGRQSAIVDSGYGKAYFEYSIPETVDGIRSEELGDRELIQLIIDNHPRKDYGLKQKFIENEVRDKGRDEVVRAYGNIIPRMDSATIIPMNKVHLANTGISIPRDAPVALGVAVSPDREWSSVHAAYRDKLGRGYIEQFNCTPGTRWLPSYIVGLCKRHKVRAVAVNNVGPARDIADEIEREGVEVLRISGSDYAASCGRVYDQIRAEPPQLIHDGAPEFVEAIRHAGRRVLGGGFAWSAQGGYIVSLESGTLALWGIDHAPPLPAEFQIG